MAEDGTFKLTNESRGWNVTESYVIQDASLTLSDAEGDVGTTPFPITCGPTEADDEITLVQAGDSVCPMSGLSLRARRE
ncbi:hypothetical protein ACOI1H_25685 [Loktanella sp. DJP18]|uniref:hypothetical protein n=1 Tax=Loktanella sp. DJP18 TaxID=3409788 RepID=UPI003BB6321E